MHFEPRFDIKSSISIQIIVCKLLYINSNYRMDIDGLPSVMLRSTQMKYSQYFVIDTDL